MKKIDMGLYTYEITGEREAEAAQEMEKRIDRLNHLPNVMYYNDELEAIRKKIAEDYGVDIR